MRGVGAAAGGGARCRSTVAPESEEQKNVGKTKLNAQLPPVVGQRDGRRTEVR